MRAPVQRAIRNPVSEFQRSSTEPRAVASPSGSGSKPYDTKRIGEDIKTVEFGWPVGMPVCRPMGRGIYEVRTGLTHNRIARVLFYVDAKNRMVLLRGFIKKTQKTPDEDLDLARRNREKHEKGI
jgi:phage-related protein